MPSPSKLGKVLLTLSLVVAAIAAIGLIATVPVQGSYQSKSQLVQRVQVDKAGASLFGDGDSNRPVGSPQQLIIEDPKAFLADKDGVKQVDDGYLQSHNIYPLQLQTVQYMVKMTRLGLLAAFIASVSVALVIRKRQR